MELLASPAQHLMLFGGSRSGKTFLLTRAVCIRAMKAPASRHAIFRFRLGHIKSSIVRDTFPKVMRLCFPGVKVEINQSELFALFPNGAEVWFGGLDDKIRVEKILGNEFSTIYLNECSQIPWDSRNMALTRLAQLAPQAVGGMSEKPLSLKMYYDCNPPDKGHWTYRLFKIHQDPESKARLPDPENYASMQINPRDNEQNLAPGYVRTLESLAGRHRKRFLEGEFRDAAPNALFTDEIIDRNRIIDESLPDMVRIVVAVDPSGADDDLNVENDEIGIVVAGLGTDGKGYCLEDCTVKAGPATWGKVATNAYERHEADVVAAETNYGGAMVKHVIRSARPGTPFKMLTASRGKVVRAEPISSLVEQGQIRFVGSFRDLEDELTAMTTHGYMGDHSPNRADAFVWAMSELFPQLTQTKPKAPPPVRAFTGGNRSLGRF